MRYKRSHGVLRKFDVNQRIDPGTRGKKDIVALAALFRFKRARSCQLRRLTVGQQFSVGASPRSLNTSRLRVVVSQLDRESSRLTFCTVGSLLLTI